MASERYIVIPRWEEFQHYRDRDPVWVKVYTRLLSDNAFRELTFHQRGVLVSLWIEYARSGRQLRDNTATLTRQLGGRVSRRDLDSLTYAGFLTFSASAPLAQSKSKSKSKNPLPHGVGNGGANPRALGQNPRALGTNPRAVAKQSKVDLHESLLALARSAATSWPLEPTDRLHDRLDALEREHGGRFTDQERQTLIDDVLAKNALPF